MHIDLKDLVPASIWEVRTPHMYMGSSRKHMGGVDTPYAYGSPQKHMGAVSIWGFTYIFSSAGDISEGYSTTLLESGPHRVRVSSY